MSNMFRKYSGENSLLSKNKKKVLANGRINYLLSEEYAIKVLE